MQKIPIAALGLLLFTQYAQAQSFAGYHSSHYAGIYGVLANPASAAGSPYKWDVNIIGADVKAGNTYARIPRSHLFNQPDKWARDVDYFLDTTSSNRQYGWAMGDLLMPSVLYSIDEKQALAFTWRIRGIANAGNVETGIANFFSIDYPNPRYAGRNFHLDYASFFMHSWNELGFSYSRIIKDNVTSRWKAGITIKFLSGIAAAYAVADSVPFVMNSRQSAVIESGSLQVGYNEQLDNGEQPGISNFGLFANPGIAADIGIIYEWRPDGRSLESYERDTWNPGSDEYKLRLGLSVTDFGAILYRKAPGARDLNLQTGNIHPDSLKYRDKEGWQRYYQRISQYFEPAELHDEEFFMETPAAVHLTGDYNINGHFFISAGAVLGFTAGRRDVAKNYVITQAQITPRFDSRYFGAYLPLMHNRFGQTDAGIGFRAGPLIIGSSSILSNLMRAEINRADAFVALRAVPISFKRRNGRGRPQIDCPPY